LPPWGKEASPLLVDDVIQEGAAPTKVRHVGVATVSALGSLRWLSRGRPGQVANGATAVVARSPSPTAQNRDQFVERPRFRDNRPPVYLDGAVIA
jgi:hypothetical protein